MVRVLTTDITQRITACKIRKTRLVAVRGAWQTVATTLITTGTLTSHMMGSMPVPTVPDRANHLPFILFLSVFIITRLTSGVSGVLSLPTTSSFFRAARQFACIHI